MSESPDHGVVGDYLERIDILDEDIAGDVLELDVVHETSNLLPKLCMIIIAIILAPHQCSLKIRSNTSELHSLFNLHLKLDVFFSIERIPTENPPDGFLRHFDHRPKREDLIAVVIHKV